VEKGEAVPPDEEDEDPLPLEVSSSPKNPPRAAGSVVSSRRAERSMRILVNIVDEERAAFIALSFSIVKQG